MTTAAAERAVREFEEAIGGRLPADYRVFLLRGATSAWPGTIVCADGTELTVRRFLPLDELPRATFETWSGRIPDVAVPIATTAGRDVLILGYDGFDAGNVWLCDRSRPRTAALMEQMRADLRARGLDEPLDDDGVVWYWERLSRDACPWRIGFADTWLVAPSFTQMLAAIRA
jgi:hypothetical protein